MTLLELIRTFCERQTLLKPDFIIGSSDTQILQIKSLVDEVCEDLVTRWTWTALTRETLFSTQAVEDQGEVSAIAPHGFLRILQETIFNRTLRLPVYGPMSQSRWQALKALPTTGPFYKYRIRGGNLWFNPVPAAGHVCAFEYASSYIVFDPTNSGYKSYATKDTDTFVLPSMLVLAGLRSKWREAKGLPYAEQLQRFEAMAADMAATDGTKEVVHLDRDSANSFPGIFASPGNWMQS